MFADKLIIALAFVMTSMVPALGQTANWRQFSSATAGYKIKYPADWGGTETWRWPVGHLILQSPSVRDYDVFQNAAIRICTQPQGLVSNSSLSDSRCSLRDDHLSDLYKKKIISSAVTDINGVKVRKTVSEDKYRPDTTYLDAFFSTKDRDVMINGSFPRRFGLEKYIPVFDHLLSTLEIVTGQSALSYSNSDYKFSISYPGTWRSCPIDNHRQKDLIMWLVPEDNLCLGANSIMFSTAVTDPTTKNRGWQEDRYVYSLKFYSTNVLAAGTLLQRREMYDATQAYRQQAEAILESFSLKPN
jgi:hypothetical protein